MCYEFRAQSLLDLAAMEALYSCANALYQDHT